MATAVNISGAKLKDLYSQRARAGLPFNPLDGEEIAGANIERLKKAMQAFGWNDLRFVTREQALLNGWSVRPKAESVEILVRDPSNGAVGNVALVNAELVKGMPGMDEMLRMTDEQFLTMRGLVSQESAEEIDLAVGPARSLQLSANASTLEPVPHLPGVVATVPGQDGPAGTVAGPQLQLDGRYAVMAPYWINGLHNFEGIAMAKQINETIAREKLTFDKAAITRLLGVYPRARALGLDVVEESRLINDPALKANVSEPRSLIAGELVRDREGAYRPKAGGLVVLKDEGTSVVLKSKSLDAYRGAMELAVAKGWTAIELKGKPAMLADAWLEARLMGLEVVNYAPNEKDREKYAHRLAEQSARKQAELANAALQETTPETVEVVPYVDAKGVHKEATVTYSITRRGVPDEVFGSPKDAAAAFAKMDAKAEPEVKRSVTRIDGVAESEVVAAKSVVNGQAVSHEYTLDPEFNAALAAVQAKANAPVASLVASALTPGTATASPTPVLPGFKKLVAQGEAPYMHDVENNKSYFVDLEGPDGQIETVWGLDLERSLSEAKVQAGDMILLTEKGAKDVTVQERQPGGGFKSKAGRRVEWETTVQGRGIASGKGQEPASDKKVVQKGQHIGPIVAIENGMMAQKTGRNPDQVVWHSLSNVGGKVPSIGEMAEISYKRGHGAIKESGVEKDKSAGLGLSR